MRLARNRSQTAPANDVTPSSAGQPSAPPQPAPDLDAPRPDDLLDTDVPAAVVCAHCGDADCPGCLHEQTRSGVVAIVPWERPGAGALARLWSTARATTLDTDRFFESLPDGPVAPALRFAIASELLATGSLALLVLLPVGLLAPTWLEHLVLEEPVFVTRMAVLGVPALASVLIVAHLAHAWALDLGARRCGARGATARALRFGLYAAGWDLVAGPLGLIILTLREGPRKALSVSRRAGRTRGSRGFGLGARAFLRGCYRLDGAAAEPALRASYVGAAVATVLGAFAFVAGVAAALLL